MDTQTQIDRLIELAIIQRSELKQLVEQLPQLREHLNAEVEKVFEETEPQLRSELEEWTTKQTQDKTAALGVALEAKIADLAKNLEVSTQARYNAIIAEREENARLAVQAEQKIAEHAASLPGAVKEIVTAELARFPRAGEIDQLRKEFAEPRGLNPRGKWQVGEVYNKLDLVTINGDSFVSNVDGNRERPSRTAANWTLNAARGTGGGTGFTSLNNVLGDPSAGQIVGSEAGQYVRKTLVAGANITINETASAITIIGDEGQISLQDGTAAAPSLFFTNDTDTGLYRPAANTLGISVSGTQVAYFDANGLTVPSAGVVAGGSIHAANGNANNPSLSFSGDQDTGFFRHQPNELGITLGGTQKATLTSTTFSITPNVSVSGTGTFGGNLTVNGATTNIGNGVSTDAVALQLGNARTGSGYALIDLVGDTTYSDYGLRVIRYNTGANANSTIEHRGTGDLTLTASEAASVKIQTNGTTALTINSSQATTLAGNLTVSGFSFVSGTLSAFSSTGGIYSYYSGGGVLASYSNGSGTLSSTTIDGSNVIFRPGGVEAMRLVAAGNALLGTTTDSGNGKLQLATHTTSAGGIGFGTDTSLYRTAASSLRLSAASSYTVFQIQGASGSYFDFYASNGTTRNGSVGTEEAGTMYVGTRTAASTILMTNSTATLTLDSSQRTFTAGGTKIGSLTGTVDSRLHVYESTSVSNSNGLTLEQASTGDSLVSFLLTGVQRWSVGIDNSDSDSFKIGTGDLGAADKLTITTGGTATFAGPVNIGNTVTAAAGVASTHKVTISIGGTTYYLLASNV